MLSLTGYTVFNVILCIIGGGGSPSVGCINPEKIIPILTGVNNNSVNVDLTFQKKIKVI